MPEGKATNHANDDDDDDHVDGGTPSRNRALTEVSVDLRFRKTCYVYVLARVPVCVMVVFGVEWIFH